ncbi:hypothetical protein KCP73_06255 [Salmonella enterica subsp. enterica]|nr:hypothetical protein KCP73_06255 [Salmonella enterica subsp. enterica]
MSGVRHSCCGENVPENGAMCLAPERKAPNARGEDCLRTPRRKSASGGVPYPETILYIQCYNRSSCTPHPMRNTPVGNTPAPLEPWPLLIFRFARKVVANADAPQRRGSWPSPSCVAHAIPFR